MRKSISGFIAFFIAIVIGFTVFIFFSKNNREKYVILSKQVKYEVDSIEYHQPGRDHTMQVTPYWKVHLKNTNIWLTSYRAVEIKDSIEVIERRVTRNYNGK